MRASIIIAAMNEGDALHRTIETCLETSPGLDHEIVVVDDASTDDAVDRVTRRFSQVRIHRHSHRLGASAAKATGAANARGEVLVFLDGHSKPEHRALNRLVEHVESFGHLGVITPAVANLDDRNWRNDHSQIGNGYTLDLLSFDCGWIPLQEMRKSEQKRTLLYESPSLIGCALAVSRELYEKLWGFDRDMLYWGVEDLDFGLKCWQMGYRILHDPDIVIGHRFRTSFHNYTVPVERPLVNQLRMARKNFTETVWKDWLERCRTRNQGGLAGAPEGLWARAWHLFQTERASAEQERSYLHAHRVHDEFWLAERFGQPWPRLQPTISREGLTFALARSPSPHPSHAPSPSPPPPILQIVDAKTGRVVSGTTITKIVGQKIQFQLGSKPPGALSNIQWTVPGQRIKNYTQNVNTATKTDLVAADLQNLSVGFYWIAKGNNLTVQVAATVGGRRLTAKVTCNVLAPTGFAMTSVTGVVAVSDNGFPPPHTSLHFGSTAKVGIAWTFKATAPKDGAGEIAATQLVNTVRTRTPNGGAVQTLSSAGKFVLDTTVPYDTAVAIAASAQATWSSNDSPSSSLTPDLSDASANDNFNIFFMYKPAGVDSIWVMIGMLAWHWAGQSTRSAPPPPNNWGPATGVSNSVNPVGGASTALPVWAANVTSLVWH